MLSSIRNAFSSGILRLVLIALMLLLVVSFAVWGIGDIFRSGGRTTVASVGKTEISVPQFQQAYNREVQQLGRQLGRGISPDRARELGLDTRVLAQLTTEAALNEMAAKYRLSIDEDGLRSRILDNPTFKGPAGSFDKTYFDDILRSNGYTEGSYLEVERRLAARQQIAAALSEKLIMPKTLIDAVNRYQNETRVADFVLLTNKQAGTLPDPKDDELATFFERRKTAFRAPEYRKLVVVSATVETLAPFVTVSPAQVDAEFTRLREGLEKRTVEQIKFPNPAAAAAAAKRLTDKSITFEALAAEMGLKPNDINLGVVGRPELIDPVIRDAAFALPEGGISEPVDGRFGTVILRASRIEKPDEGKVKEEIERNLAQQGARDQANALHDRIEKERASGLPLADIARKVGIEPVEIDQVDRLGNDATGTVLTIPGGNEVLTAAFKSDVGVENDPIQARPAGYIWFEVAGITPARDRTLDEVKDKVTDAWRTEETRARLVQMANAMVTELGKGKTLAALATEKALEVKTTKPITRNTSDADIGSAAVQMIFATPKDKVAAVAGTDPGEQIVLHVKTVSDPPPNAIDPRGREQFVRGMEDDLLAQYIRAVQNQIGLSVNQTMLRRAAGGGDAPN